jgi:tetratricopeptide (TPR) repeat protein
MSIFWAVVAKQCRTPGCGEVQRRADRHEGFCKECQQPLGEIRGLDVWRISLITLGLAVLTLTLIWLPPRLKAALARREPSPPAQREVTSTQSLEQNQQRGHELASQGRYEAARRAFRSAVESDPTDATAWANLGLAASLTNHQEEALDCYTRALRLEPSHWLAHYNLGLFWDRRGDRERALEHLERAFAALPGPGQRGDLERDLRSASISAPLRNDPRFVALLGRGTK